MPSSPDPLDTAFDSLFADVEFPCSVCILGPRGSGKTHMAIALALFFRQRHLDSAHFPIYVASNGFHEYEALPSRLLAVNDKVVEQVCDNLDEQGIHLLRETAHYPSRNDFFAQGLVQNVPASHECLLILDMGFTNHDEQVALHKWMDQHPSASVILVEFIKPEPILARDMHLVCDWDHDQKTGERGFRVYPYSEKKDDLDKYEIVQNTPSLAYEFLDPQYLLEKTMDSVWITVEDVWNTSYNLYQEMELDGWVDWNQTCTIL